MFTRSDNLRSHCREKHGVDWGRIRGEGRFEGRVMGEGDGEVEG